MIYFHVAGNCLRDMHRKFRPRGAGAMRDHLQRLLHHTRLKAVQWINLNRHVVEFTTLSKKATNRIMAGQNHKSGATREQAPARGI